jgi:hypothetical protein
MSALSRTFRALVGVFLFFFFFLTIGISHAANPAQANSVTITPQPNATVGASNTVAFKVLDQNQKAFSYDGTAQVTVTPGQTQPDSSTSSPIQIKFSNGIANMQIQFMAAGAQSITVKSFNPAFGQGAQDSFSQTLTVGVASTSANALAGCATCFATIGAGVVLVGKYPDYNVSSNVIQATHIGISTPSIAAGVAYKLPFHEPFGFYDKLHCTAQDLTTKRSDAQIAFCYPWKAFVSLKITPDASQTLNGFTYGFSHALHQYLDLMIGIAYSAHNEISPGFRAAAINVVTAQQAAKNPNYAQFNISQMENLTSQTAFDGFPTQLISATGAPGALIYSGSVTVNHFRAGLFMGVSFPLSFKSAVAGQ